MSKNLDISNEQLAHRAIKLAFTELKKKILLTEDIKKLSDLQAKEIRELVLYYQIITSKNNDLPDEQPDPDADPTRPKGKGGGGGGGDDSPDSSDLGVSSGSSFDEDDDDDDRERRERRQKLKLARMLAIAKIEKLRQGKESDSIKLPIFPTPPRVSHCLLYTSPSPRDRTR